MNCDAIARWYRWLEYLAFGRALEKARFEYLRAAAGARRVLVLGDGDGRFLAALARENRDCDIDSIDTSGEMLRLAKVRLNRARTASLERVHLHHADAREFQFPRDRYDLIATHFFLDCFKTEEMPHLISRIARAAAPHATWLIAEFREPKSGFGRYRARLTIWASYLFFRFATGLQTKALPDYRPALIANGFRLCGSRLRSNGMLISELWQRK